jgi:hypothetical protein
VPGVVAHIARLHWKLIMRLAGCLVALFLALAMCSLSGCGGYRGDKIVRTLM